MSNLVLSEVKKLIDKIMINITIKDINISDLCLILRLSEDEFVDIINNPRMNVSLYLEILDVITNMKEV